MKKITKSKLQDGIQRIFASNQATLKAVGDFPADMYLRCMIVISLRIALALNQGDKSSALELVSKTVNECIDDEIL